MNTCSLKYAFVSLVYVYAQFLHVVMNERQRGQDREIKNSLVPDLHIGGADSCLDIDLWKTSSSFRGPDYDDDKEEEEEEKEEEEDCERYRTLIRITGNEIIMGAGGVGGGKGEGSR